MTERKKTYQQRYAEKNKERIKAYQKEYRKKNREKNKAYQKKYYRENREAILAFFKLYRQTPHRQKLTKEWYQQNKDRINAKKRHDRLIKRLEKENG